MGSAERPTHIVFWPCCDEIEPLREGMTVHLHEYGYVRVAREVRAQVNMELSVRYGSLEADGQVEVLSEDMDSFDCDEGWLQCPHCGDFEVYPELILYEDYRIDHDLDEDELDSMLGVGEPVPSEPDVFNLLLQELRAA